MTRALVIADDLTGAMDSGGEFAARGFETVLALDRGDPNRESAEMLASEVLVVDTDSRSATARTARRAIEAAIDARSAGIVYKKIDSTLRGHLVPEIDAAIAASGADLAVVAPAFPATGRTTRAGIHLVDGVPITEALDGEGPESARLSTLLAGSAYPVLECPIARVNRGSGAVRELLSSVRRPAIVACDATKEGDLDAIARAAAEVGEDVEREVLYVGSAGLARHVRLPDSGSADGEPADAPPVGSEPIDDPVDGESTNGEPTAGESRGGKVLAVAGSANPRTIEGVTALPEEWVIGLDLPGAITDPESAASEAGSRAIGTLAEEELAVVTSVPDRGAIERARKAGRAAGLEDGAIGERIERALAATAARVCAEEWLDGLFLTGGATARGVLDALGAVGISLTDGAIERGVPVGQVLGGQADGTKVVTKAGGFGTSETIANCLAYLQERDERP